MTERELRAVAEAIIWDMYKQSGSPELIHDKNCEGKLEFCGIDIYKSAQAAIAASDSRYVKGLVEALKRINIEIEDTVDRYNGTPLQRLQLVKKISYHALQTLPEDLR